MARTTPRPQPTTALVLRPLAHDCARCGEPRWAAYHNDRTVTTWAPVVRLTLQRRRCAHPACPQVGQPSRPEEAGRRARPKHACGLEVIARVGTLRSAQPRSVPESHPELERRRVVIAPRTGLPLWERSDARRARSRTDTTRLQRLTAAQGQGMLALDGLSTRCRAGRPLGPAGWPRRRGAPRAPLALSDPRGLGHPPHCGAPVLTGADRGGPLRWSTRSPPRRGPGLTHDPTPTVSLACSPRGRKAHRCS